MRGPGRRRVQRRLLAVHGLHGQGEAVEGNLHDDVEINTEIEQRPVCLRCRRIGVGGFQHGRPFARTCDPSRPPGMTKRLQTSPPCD